MTFPYQLHTLYLNDLNKKAENKQTNRFLLMLAAKFFPTEVLDGNASNFQSRTNV